MNIEINMDSVVIESQIVQRPEYVSRGQWLMYWEAVKAIKEHKCQHCGVSTWR